MNKILLSLTLALGLFGIAQATVPQRRQFTHKQPDGTSLRLTSVANGRYITYATTDGLAVLRGTDGNFYYAQPAAGEWQCTTHLAHNQAERTTAETALLNKHSLPIEAASQMLTNRYPTPRLQRATRSEASTADGLGTYKKSAPGTVCSIGSPVIPVVMVNFADRTFTDTIDATKVTRFFNEPGYADEQGSKGSVKDYFTAQSQGLFTPTFSVVATVTLPKGYAYYGANSTSGRIDEHITDFITDALAQAEKTVDFSAYATNGEVPLVSFMFAGPGEQSSFEKGCEDYIWAQFSTRSFTVNQGAVRINSYFVGNELLQSYGATPNDITAAHMDGVGLFSHEFGHALGLPDFYYTGRDAAVKDSLLTMDYWSIMDYGQYYFNGYAPPGYTAYERSFMGWLRVTELSEAQTGVKLYAFGQEELGPTAYVIRNPECPSEYYLLENRQIGTWYPKRMGTGMLVTHVDYEAGAWLSNAVNNDPLHQRMAYIPADNKKDGTRTGKGMTLTQLFNGYKGDLFPGLQNVTSLTDDTLPATTLFNGTAGKLGKPILNISQNEQGVISFDFITPGPSSITEMPGTTPTAAKAVYSLTGRRILNWQQAEPGVYILSDGTKVIKH